MFSPKVVHGVPKVVYSIIKHSIKSNEFKRPEVVQGAKVVRLFIGRGTFK